MIPFVTYDPHAGVIRLYAAPNALGPATFEMDPEQTRELIAMLVGAIVAIEHDPARIELLFAELLDRAKKDVG